MGIIRLILGASILLLSGQANATPIIVDTEAEFSAESVYAALADGIPERGRNFADMDCYFCNKKGHGWRRCPDLQATLRRNGMRPFPYANRQPTAQNSRQLSRNED